jgi:hypothetical protein
VGSRGEAPRLLDKEMVMTAPALPSDLLNLDRYPLDQPESAACLALVARSQADLAAFPHRRDHNIYFRKEIPGLNIQPTTR